MDWTEALTRLLSDPTHRQAFLDDRESWVEPLGIDAVTRAALLALDEQDLNEAARGLIDKRRHEVRKLAPLTWRGLSQQVVAAFDEYAFSHWPSGHDRHLRDAVQFLRWLERRESDSSTFESERKWLEFLLGNQHQWFGLVRDQGRLYACWYRRVTPTRIIRRRLRLWPL